MRKKARHSWGNEARWTVASDVPSPTKRNRTADWIQEEDLLSPRKASRRSTPNEESQSPISGPSPIAARPIETDTLELRSQYTQELMNQVSGDTEEDTDMEDVQASAIPDRMSRERSYESPLRQSFSVFRDATFAGTNEGIGVPLNFDTEDLPGFSEPLDTSSLQEEEDSFFNLPSSDSIEALDGGENDMSFGGPVGESSYMPFQRTSSLARELLESDEVDEDEIERQAHGRSELGTENQERENIHEEDSRHDRLERDESESQENSMEELDREAPVIEGAESGGSQRHQNSQEEEIQRELQVLQKEEIESSTRQSVEPADNIDPFLQGYEVPTTAMAPPSLPTIQTSNFDLDPVVSMAPPSRPGSPKTPDLRPQQSAALPLPSPFPGDDLATSYMDHGASDWQPSQGFMVPLRKSLPAFGFGFGFESDGLDRRYSTNVDDPDTDNIAASETKIIDGKIELDLPEQQLAVTPTLEIREPEIVPAEDLESAMPSDEVPHDELPTNFSPSETFSLNDSIQTKTKDVDALLEVQSDPRLYQDVVHDTSFNDVQMSYTEEQVVSAHVPAEMAGAKMAHSEMTDDQIDDAKTADGMMFDAKIADDEMEDADQVDDRSIGSPQVEYPDLPPANDVSSHACQVSASEVDDVLASPNLRAIERSSPDGVLASAGPDHTAYAESEREEQHEVMARAEDSSMGDDERDEDDGAEDIIREQSSGMGDEGVYSEDEKGVEQEFSEDDNEEGYEEEGGVPIGPDHRFGPPLSTSTGPSISAREVISLLSDSDDSSSSEVESDLESVDGDQEDAQLTRANLIDEEVESESEGDSESESESDADDDAMESSGSEDEDDPSQGLTTHGLEPSGSQYIPSFDGANDSPPSSSFVPALMSEDRFSSSMPTLDTPHASHFAPSMPATIDDRVPSSTAPLPSKGRTVVIELGSDLESEEEAQTIPSTAPMPAIKHELTERTEIKDTYEPFYNDDESMQDHASVDVINDHVPTVDERTEDQLTDLSDDAQQNTVPEEQKSNELPQAPSPSKRRPAVTFAPRVSRRRALGGSQLTTQLEHQSSQALASSQDTIKRPRLVVQDTFEGMIHSDGPVTTAPPSSRGHDSEATTDDENDTPLTQIRVGTDYPSHNEAKNGQPMSSPPVMMSDAYPDDQISNSKSKGEVTRPQQSSRRQRSRPQQSMAENTLVTPDASQFTQSQPSFSVHDDESTFPPTPMLTQTTSNSARHESQPHATQQSFDGDFQNHQKAEKTMARAKRDTSSVERLKQDASEALTVKLSKLQHDDKAFHELFLGESEKVSQKIRESSDGPLAKLDAWFSPRKPKRQDHSSSKLSYGSVSKLDTWHSPHKTKQQYQPSSPPQSFEDEPLPESQTLRGDRFDSQGLEFDENDDMLSSRFDTANGRNSMSPTVKHQNFMAQSLKNDLKDEEDDYPSSQLPDFRFSQSQPSQTKGLNTSWGYYTPVSNLMTKVSTQVSQFADDLADVIAVVTKNSTRPLRAESGPRDYVTEFLISDEDFWPKKVSVKIYRPWKPALPILEDGDIILLRGFNVIPTKKGVGLYMRSNESSSWCAWKFSLKVEENDLSSDSDQPMWSQKITAGEELTLKDREVCTAAEAQRGDEERDFVHELREWWVNKD